MMKEEERKAIVEGPVVYLHDGLKVTLGGYLNPDYCSITSARPGFWACDWARVKEVQESESKRFGLFDLWKTSSAWLGVRPGADDFQTVGEHNENRFRHIQPGNR